MARKKDNIRYESNKKQKNDACNGVRIIKVLLGLANNSELNHLIENLFKNLLNEPFFFSSVFPFVVFLNCVFLFWFGFLCSWADLFSWGFNLL